MFPMQNVLSSVPIMGMVLIISLGIIAVIAACLLLISGVQLQRMHRMRGLPHPRIVAGLLLLVFGVAQVINELVSVYAPGLGWSRNTVTIISILANAFGILLFMAIPYGYFFRIHIRHGQLEEEILADDESDNESEDESTSL